MSDDEDEQFRIYREDKRIPCRYGVKCYQKNAVHHEKYKHPPAKKAKNVRATKRITINKKRKKEDNTQKANDSPKKKIQKRDEEISDEELQSIETTTESDIVKDSNEPCEVNKESEDSDHTEPIKISMNLIPIESLLQNLEVNVENDIILETSVKAVISHLFLTEMPEDFFQFYEFCKSISEKDPLNALKNLHLQLVGPYDVFRKGFLNAKVEDKEALLRHWRYYYDPPEFQTIIKHNGKDGLHFGYWRDVASEKPVFVAKNKAAISCIIEPVAENIFGTLDVYIGEQLKLVSPFEKVHITKLHQKLKNFAKEKEIILEKKTNDMVVREKHVVARTFHKAGIVVPYNKKTQLGYRDLAVTDSELQKNLKQIEHPPVPEGRKTALSKLEEVIRLATIAADECDFGTVLELGHDLFSSGISFVQTKALNLLSLAYNLLQRPQFLEIAQAHLKNRKKHLDLSILHFD